MSDSYSYSYSDASASADDYSYSYSYSDPTIDKKVAAKGGNKAAKAREPKPGPAAAATSDSATDSYDYSYSYSDPSAPRQTSTPYKGAATPAANRGARSNPKAAAEDGTGSYSYSYSYSDEDDYEDYSYTGSQSEASGSPQLARRHGPTPTPAEAAAEKKKKGTGATTGSSSPPPSRQPTSVPAAAVPKVSPAHAAVANEDSGSYSYSYSYPEEAGRQGKGRAGAGEPSDTYYAYSDDYGTYSYSYSDEEGSNAYYTDSYSYTGDSSYYYSSSSADAAGAGGRGTAKKLRSGSTTSFYYSDSYSDAYVYSESYDKSDDYYSGDTYRYSENTYGDSDEYYYSDDEESEEEGGDDAGSYSYSYTDSAASKAASSTTSSYGDSGSNPSVLSVTETDRVRDTVVLRAPAKDTPHAPAAPKRCFVAHKSVEDNVWSFLERLMRMQQSYEARRTAASAATTSAAAAAAAAGATSFLQRAAPPASPAATEGGESATAKEADTRGKGWRSKLASKRGASAKDTTRKKRKNAQGGTHEADEESLDNPAAATSPFLPTKEGCLSERSLRIAFRVLRMNHLERTEALNDAPVPMPMATMVDTYNTCVAARVRERVAQAFLAHDTYRSGEVTLSVMGGLLRRLGLGTSPVLEGHRISLAVSSDATPELVMNVERLVQTASSSGNVPAVQSTAAEAAEGAGEDGVSASPSTAPSPPAAADAAGPMLMQWEVTPVYVSRIVRKNAAAKQPTPVLWERNTVYMGRHVIVRHVASAALFERLKTYIEAATYLCVLTNIFSIHDAVGGSVTVQYPQFVRSVLLATPPSRRRAPSTPMKLLAMENVFRTVFHPMEVLRSFEAGRGFPRYLHDWAVESTLHATNDTEEKRRRNVLPSISADNVRFNPAPTTRPPTEGRLSFVLQKVRVPGKPPSHARCFCLVSAITAANVFLPAIEVPVHDIVKSRKDPDGFTWIFYKKHHKKDAILHFAGPAVDRIYVECCYETTEAPLVGEEGEEEQADGGAAVLADCAVTTVWCAGYTVFAVDGAKTAALPVSRGTLLHNEDAAKSATATTPEAAASANPGPTPKSGKWVFRFLSRLGKHKRSLAAVTASTIKIEVVKSKRPIVGVEKLPARFLAYQRHVPMIARLRTAVEVVGKDTDHALQALRHQAVRYIFSVAADAALLDQLCKLWAHRTKHWSKAERKDPAVQHTQLLGCVAALYALHNCCASSTHLFAQALLKEKSLHMPLDAGAPQLPVRV